MISMQCDCEQKQHSAPIKTIEVSENASDKVVEILKDYNRIFLVADENTYEVLGKKVEKLLKDAGAEVAGIGIVIGKCFQPGLKKLRDAGFRVEVLAPVKKMSENIIEFGE